MTELEQQLTTALVRLSRQYSLEQQQQAEIITTLSRQVEQLTKQVTALAHSYSRLEEWRN